MMQTKCKLHNLELFLELFYVLSKEIGNKKGYEVTRELEKWQSEILPEYWLNAIKTKIAFFKGRLDFSSKGKTTANVHLMGSP